ncbi:hypothetical protein HRI_001480000 [Hibiscus trionum]|uniref:Uncharacterized protein n=1 Tax=Hibiscus trionum TaxID=183268 RepID=A0A9W7LUJ1_HIBTR|nr:hypothetical protein HRI_001480000 [Hibiscus trionum]
MEMLTICSASRHHIFFTHSISKSLNSDSLQASIFLPLRRPLPVRLRSSSTTRPPRCISAGPPLLRLTQTPQPGNFTLEIFSAHVFVFSCYSFRGTGLVGKLSRFQDRARIFFAVLFWMSLFFWYSALDGRNSDKPNKGSRFRR